MAGLSPGAEEAAAPAFCAEKPASAGASPDLDGSHGTALEGTDGAQAQAQEGANSVTEPERLLCPITHIMYRDPCFVPESGNTYERLAVERYWSSTPRPRDPLTNVELGSRVLHPNWGVRREVQRFLEEHPGYLPQGWSSRKVPLPGDDSAGSGRGRGAGAAAGASVAALLRGRRALSVALVAVLLAAAGGSFGLTAWRSAARHAVAPPEGAMVLHPPKGSPLQAWSSDGEQLMVHSPARGVDTDMVGQLVFAVIWTGFTACWTVGAVSNGAPVLFVMFSLPFWGVGGSMLVSAAKAPWQSETLDMGSESYALTKAWLGVVLSNNTGQISDLSGLPVRACDGERCELVFEDGLQELSFGSSLRTSEAKWLQSEIQQHLLRTPGGHRFGVTLPERTADRRDPPFGHTSRHGNFHFGVFIR